MRFVQGTIERIRDGEGGSRRLLLRRKDDTYFVAVVPKSLKIGGTGTIFKAGGFVARDQMKGREVYEMVNDQSQNTGYADLSQKSVTNSQGAVSIPENPDEQTEIEECSIELAAIINLTSLLMQQSTEETVRDVKDTFSKLCKKKNL